MLFSERIIPDISTTEVLRLLGVNQLSISKIDKKYHALIIDSIKEVAEIINPIIYYQIFSFNETELEKITKIFTARQDKLVLFAASLGKEIDQKIELLFKEKSYTEATIIDAIASAAIEDLKNKALNNLKDLASTRNLSLTKVYYPGNNNLELKLQPLILKLLKVKPNRLTTNQNYMLSPLKSITAIVGLNQEQTENKPTEHNCLTCNLNNCNYRKESLICLS